MTAYLAILRRFPTTFRRFQKILQNLSEGRTNVVEHFPKMSKDYLRLSKIFEEDPKIFRSYTNEFKYNLGDKLDTSENIDILTSEDISDFHITHNAFCFRHKVLHKLLFSNALGNS